MGGGSRPAVPSNPIRDWQLLLLNKVRLIPVEATGLSLGLVTCFACVRSPGLTLRPRTLAVPELDPSEGSRC
jgi:hypothetical protein